MPGGDHSPESLQAPQAKSPLISEELRQGGRGPEDLRIPHKLSRHRGQQGTLIDARGAAIGELNTRQGRLALEATRPDRFRVAALGVEIEDN